MPSIGVPELIIILLILLLLLGGKKLPELFRSIGKSIKEIRNGMKDEDKKEKPSKKANKK
jgi:sec-independent protein translocase protein TatA